MYNLNFTKLSKQSVLAKISQQSIFAKYMNIDESLIEYCIENRKMICSPLRIDRHPTCSFYFNSKGKLIFKDFSGHFCGDCFSLVAFVMSYSYKRIYDVKDKYDFIKILKHITIAFKNIFYGKDIDESLQKSIQYGIERIRNSKQVIECVIRDWNNEDVDYWSKFGISIHLLNLNFVYPIEQYYINRNANPYPKYFYKKTDPCYAYLCGVDKNGINNIKLYFPKRKKSEKRFITNFSHLEGIYNLQYDDYDAIIITKSTKDRLSIVSFLTNIDIKHKIGVINIPSETYRLKAEEYEWFCDKLANNGKIFSLMDNDRTGKLEAIWLKNTYKIIPLLIPSNTKCKDFAELYSTYSKGFIFSLINEIIVKYS